jgi:hypothetical protein
MFPGATVHEPRARFILSDIIGEPNVFARGYFNDGTLSSFFIGEVCDHPFMDVKLAQDLFIYSVPNARGGMAVVKLTKQFVDWAKDQDAYVCKLEISAGINNTRATEFFGKLGFRSSGSLMLMELS